MKDKTQKSFRGIVRILLLVFCYTFGSHAFALALEHEQTVDIYKVTDVPNPRNESSSNWVSNPNQILDESYVWEINNMLSQLEDSLSIEVTVVALPSIGEDIPAEFAHKLFEHWGIGKKTDDNGLLILLVLDQRKVTFATGYGLEGVLPDALCFRIQQNEMVPWFRKNDFDRGITEGVRAVTLVLYGSDYEPVSQGTSDNYWKSASNTLWNFLANQPLMLWIFLILVNVLTYRMKVNKARPKDSSALAAIKVLTHYSPLGCLVLFFPVWPALIAASLWYKFYQKQRVILQSKTC
ncbi:TPM domain-containing protein, partial [Bacteroides ovatus]